MTVIFALVAIALLTGAVLSAVRFVPRYFRWRGTRLVTCPETRRPAAVQIDVPLAAVTEALGHALVLLENCSRWPERKDCGRQCVQQIEQAPEDCLLRVMLARWYEGKRCLRCDEPVDAQYWHGHRPGWLTPDGRPVTWNDIHPEQVPDALSSYRPLCWDCQIVERFRREHPDLVVDRHQTMRKEHRNG